MAREPSRPRCPFESGDRPDRRPIQAPGIHTEISPGSPHDQLHRRSNAGAGGTRHKKLLTFTNVAAKHDNRRGIGSNDSSSTDARRIYFSYSTASWTALRRRQALRRRDRGEGRSEISSITQVAAGFRYCGTEGTI